MSVIDRIAAQTAADVIKNETVPLANTAARVGGLLRDLADSAAIGTVVPVVLSANQNNWAPTDFVKAKDGTLRVTTNDATQRVITGFAAQVHGFRFRIVNRGSGNVVINSDPGSASLAANRVLTGMDTVLFLQPSVGSAELEYDATIQRWLVVSWQNMRGTLPPFPIGVTTSAGGSFLWADGDHKHAFPMGAGLAYNGTSFEAKGERATDYAATLATADATITTAVTIPLADNTRYDVRAVITGRSDTNALILQEVSVSYSRKSAGAPVQSGTPVAPSTNSVGAGVGYVIDTSSNDLRIRVQGAAAMDINWDVKVWAVARALPAQPA